MAALVTMTAVCRWSPEGDPQPGKVSDRHASLAGWQVVHSRIDELPKGLLPPGLSGKWCGWGSAALPGGHKGSAALGGHAAAFVEIKIGGDARPSTSSNLPSADLQEERLELNLVSSPRSQSTAVSIRVTYDTCDV
ncbi:clathrin heavy chain 2 [Choloepus didactylus]|uniref:clathrin heavy chain 2 n=1 Tax=Choloepus didactylus TaxID=27675 RepID=UPI00189F3DF4|nr:clathrin heavy chain 2 [Choloepus didactylus]XP_037679564.1 clathrin heavy chain 2 [Choloepus didactylus]